jgi:hypothetical protein
MGEFASSLKFRVHDGQNFILGKLVGDCIPELAGKFAKGELAALQDMSASSTGKFVLILKCGSP